jgi:hypothetical protein
LKIEKYFLVVWLMGTSHFLKLKKRIEKVIACEICGSGVLKIQKVFVWLLLINICADIPGIAPSILPMNLPIFR